jgi:hypothetical protein
MLLRQEIKVLSLGLKHVITPAAPSNSIILQDFNRFIRSVRLRYQFFNSPPDDTPAIFRIANPDFIPDKAPYLIDKYLQSVRHKIFTNLHAYKAVDTPTSDANTKFLNTIALL